jgi:predicted metal-dependent phosphoesterase TrpH
MIKVEFHCHTIFSHDSLVSIDDLYIAAKNKHVDRVIITDHNRIDGAIIAHAKMPDTFIVGEEVMTTEGEILAAFVKEIIPKRLTPLETIQKLRDQGSFIWIPHPFDKTRSGSWDLDELKKIAPFVDAIEVFNSRCLNNDHNGLAANLAKEYSLLEIVGSDAHSTYELGRSTLTLPDFNNAQELRQSLTNASMDIHLTPFWVHFLSTWAKLKKKHIRS